MQLVRAPEEGVRRLELRHAQGQGVLARLGEPGLDTPQGIRGEDLDANPADFGGGEWQLHPLEPGQRLPELLPAEHDRPGRSAASSGPSPSASPRRRPSSRAAQQRRSLLAVIVAEDVQRPAPPRPRAIVRGAEAEFALLARRQPPALVVVGSHVQNREHLAGGVIPVAGDPGGSVLVSLPPGGGMAGREEADPGVRRNGGEFAVDLRAVERGHDVQVVRQAGRDDVAGPSPNPASAPAAASAATSNWA